MPTKENDRSKLITSFMCDRETDKKLDYFCERININKSQLIRLVLKDFCKNPKENYQYLISKSY